MNNQQRLWWEQARSDLEVFHVLARQDAAACHQLHYLQMITEKISKAYFWRTGTPPPRKHGVFVHLLRRLGGCRRDERKSIIETLGFPRFEAFQTWVRSILPLAYDLQQLAPALAGDNGPNPEYPWPHDEPIHAPATFPFLIWTQLTQTGRGHQFLQVSQLLVRNFAAIA